MSWKDEEIDKLFGEAAEKQVFEYRPEYWKDIEIQLPINKKRKLFVWWWTASIFIAGFIGMLAFDMKNIPQKSIVSETQLLNDSKENDLRQKNFLIKNEGTINTIQNQKNEISANALSENVRNNSAPAKNISSPSTFNRKQAGFTDILVEKNVVSEPVVKIPLDVIENHVIAESFSKESDNNPIDIEETYNLTLSPRQLEFIVLNPQLEIAELHDQKKNFNQFFIEINGGIAQSWIRNEYGAAPVNASLGGVIAYSFPIKKFSVSAGLGFQATKFENLKIMDRTLVYGFSSSILENSYEFSSIYALTIPLAINFNKGRHAINFGITTSMNLFTRLKHAQMMDGYKTYFRTGVSGVSFFNRFGIQPSIGYSYSINENTQIGVRAEIQILEPLKSNRFIGTHYKFPFDGQVYLRRTLDF